MKLILGIDEVGRGSLAGPLYVGACILHRRDSESERDWQAKLTDSKLLTKARRKLLASEIGQRALAVGLGAVESAEIDRFGLTAALKTAARLAVANLIKASLTDTQSVDVEIPPGCSARDFSMDFLASFKEVSLPFEEIIIDGPQNFLEGTFLENRTTNLNKADLLIKEVSAASIIAKVHRDLLMAEYASDYPAYAFDRNAGYGTRAHIEALSRLGPCPIHRFCYGPVEKAFRQNGMNPDYLSELTFQNFPNSPELIAQSTTKSLGDRAESVVVAYLKESGHKILARNLKTRNYEVDIISKESDRIYFTEVKYRKSGNPLDAVTPKKHQKMSLAADAVMDYLSETLNQPLDSLPTPVLAVASVSGLDFRLNNWFSIT